ncbi:hypothetical protein [Pseudalkalibacillus salsuginis]|uniref:hypothetical protein n=1 Tax=Pseudalkalibacillus salsuginis TaxID=2910972 RepID=UPI001F1B3E1A|nr:hypothetical protein [Pseudalkalibacillus salsuginis]MCF6408472.1 hypothetical protein [Pseudalkalibacillus salsuginis]
MEILFGYILYLLPLFIILYVLYSLSLIKSKLDTVMNHLEINEYAEEVVSDEEIEKVLEEQMEKE